MSTAPARILGVPGGNLVPRGPADIILLDPNREWTVHKEDLHSQATNTPFVGMRLTGRVVMTICRGEVVYQDIGI